MPLINGIVNYTISIPQYEFAAESVWHVHSSVALWAAIARLILSIIGGSFHIWRRLKAHYVRTLAFYWFFLIAESTLSITFELLENDGFLIASWCCGIFAAADFTVTLAKFKSRRETPRSCCTVLNAFFLGAISSIMICVFDPPVVIHHTLYVCIATLGSLFALTKNNNKFCRAAAFCNTAASWGLFAYDVHSSNVIWRPPVDFIHVYMLVVNGLVTLFLVSSYVFRHVPKNTEEAARLVSTELVEHCI